MLKSRICHMSVVKGVLTSTHDEEREMSLAELLEHFQIITHLPHLSSYEGDVSGTRGFVSVFEDKHILHAYFEDEVDIIGDEEVRFELTKHSGERDEPRPPLIEITGYMTSDCLCEALRLLDDGRSPVEYIQANASLDDDDDDFDLDDDDES